MTFQKIIKLLGKKHFNLYKKYLLSTKVSQPFQSFLFIYQQATQRSLNKTAQHSINKIAQNSINQTAQGSINNAAINKVMKGSINKQSKQCLVYKIALIHKMLRLRSYHFPIQYMCKQWQFLDLKLKLKPPILIPRFQTEQMLVILKQDERFIKKINEIKKQGRQFRYLQLGCGSGAIGLSLGKYFRENNIRYKGQMIDIDKRAIQLSKINMRLNNLDDGSMLVYEQDMIRLLQRGDKERLLSMDLIISNPPYISINEYNKGLQRQVKRYESKQALVGCQQLNRSGLYYVQKIINSIRLVNDSNNFVNKQINKKYQLNDIQNKLNDIQNRPINNQNKEIYIQNKEIDIQNKNKGMIVIQYGGQDLRYLGQQIQKNVIKDYYGKRRFIFLLQ